MMMNQSRDRPLVDRSLPIVFGMKLGSRTNRFFNMGRQNHIVQIHIWFLLSRRGQRLAMKRKGVVAFAG
jgi:hypothetical protein